MKKFKDKILSRSPSQRSKNKSTGDHAENPLRTSRASLDWLAGQTGTLSQKSPAIDLSESKIASIERWRIAVYLTDLLRVV
jgi:hypothetical protein